MHSSMNINLIDNGSTQNSIKIAVFDVNY